MSEHARDKPGEDRRLLTAGAGWTGLLLLVGLLCFLLWGAWGAYLKVRESTAKTENRVLASTIANALEQYRENEGRLPPPHPSQREGADSDTDTSEAAGLVAALLTGGKAGGGTDYLDAFKPATADPDTPEGWKGGLVNTPGRRAIYDVHGGFFRVRIDRDQDGCIANPDPGADPAAPEGGAILRARVAVWTAGKDGDWDTWEDNVIHLLPVRAAVPRALVP